MSRADRVALFLSILTLLAAYVVTTQVFESMPHIEDEMAYVWQAEALSRGQLKVPSPPEKESFLVPFVVDYQGQRFGKYPLGWPVVLAVGIWVGGRSLVNPLLAGFAIWLIYSLGKRCFNELVGLLAAGLTLSSPFFLMNSGSLLSHPFGLVLSTSFALGWLAAWEKQPKDNPSNTRHWLAILTAAGSLCALTLTRPLTAASLSIPFAVHGIFLFVTRNWKTRRELLVFGLIVLAIGSLHFVWQYALTGDPLFNPYTLWWEYDKVGFGPGFGRTASGHTLQQAWTNTRFSLYSGWNDLFGWAGYSWILLPFGLLGLIHRRNWKALLPVSIFPTLVIVYLAYWIGSSLFGPRYYYEGLYSLTILSAAGIAYLAGWPLEPDQPWKSYIGLKKLRPLGVTALIALLVSANLLFYTPIRLQGMHGLYGIARTRMEPFLTSEAKALTPALVIVHPDKWTEYGSLLDLQDPFLDTPFVFVISRGNRADTRVINAFPERSAIYYYPDEPYTFYQAPRPEE